MSQTGYVCEGHIKKFRKQEGKVWKERTSVCKMWRDWDEWGLGPRRRGGEVTEYTQIQMLTRISFNYQTNYKFFLGEVKFVCPGFGRGPVLYGRPARQPCNEVTSWGPSLPLSSLPTPFQSLALVPNFSNSVITPFRSTILLCSWRKCSCRDLKLVLRFQRE
jgi:hypothetical protein